MLRRAAQRDMPTIAVRVLSRAPARCRRIARSTTSRASPRRHRVDLRGRGTGVRGRFPLQVDGDYIGDHTEVELGSSPARLTRRCLSQDCVFCEIVAGELDAQVVFEGERSLAFLDNRPLFPGHSLLVPREHHEALWDLPEELVGPLFADARMLSAAIRDAMGAEGAFVAMNNIVSQSVPHFHVHVVPRNRKDGLRGFFWPRRKYEGDDHAAETAASIRAAVAEPGLAGLAADRYEVVALEENAAVDVLAARVENLALSSWSACQRPSGSSAARASHHRAELARRSSVTASSAESKRRSPIVSRSKLSSIAVRLEHARGRGPRARHRGGG